MHGHRSLPKCNPLQQVAFKLMLVMFGKISSCEMGCDCIVMALSSEMEKGKCQT